MLTALPSAAYFLFLEAAAGGTAVLLWTHARGDVTRGFTLFTGWCFAVAAVLAVWLRLTFPPTVIPEVEPLAPMWSAGERTLAIAFIVLLVTYLVALQRQASVFARLLAPAVALTGVGALWLAALVEANGQLGGLGEPLAVLLGSMALGGALTGLSLGHWYLVAPTLSLRPLIRVTFFLLAALVAQSGLLLLLLASGPTVQRLIAEQPLFFVIRVTFGLLVPVAATVMVWRTARIRSLDSATGLLYVVATMVLVGEIVARTLYFLAGTVT